VLHLHASECAVARPVWQYSGDIGWRGLKNR